MAHFHSGQKSNVADMDSSPGMPNFQHTTSDGSEIHGESSLVQKETGRGKSRKHRIIFNAAQLNALERLFQDVAYPDLELRTKIAERLDIDEGRVTVWFQNRRAKYRRSAKKGTNDLSSDLKNGPINSPASTGSQEPSHGEQSPFAGPGGQNFVQSVPVSGVEYSTWVNHSYSGGDQSTTIHLSRDMKQTFHKEGDPSNHGLPKDDSNQQRTLEWLRTQNSPQTSPGDVTVTNPHSQKRDVPQAIQRLEEISKKRPCDRRELEDELGRNGSSILDDTVVCNDSPHSFHGEDTFYQGNESRGQSKHHEGLPPNMDVQELRVNHLREALERIGADHSNSTGSGTPFQGVQHPPIPPYQGNIPSQIQPYPSPFNGYPSNFPHYDSSLRPVHMASPSRQYHYNPDFMSFSPSPSNHWDTISHNSHHPGFSRNPDLPENSQHDSKFSKENLPQRDPYASCSTCHFSRPTAGHGNRKRRRSFSDESEESRGVRKMRKKRKFRKRRRTVRKLTKRTDLSLAELANPNRHNHVHFDFEKNKDENKCRSKARKNVKRKLRRHASSSWDEADSSSESEKRSTSTSIFSSTSDSDFESPYCRLTRNRTVTLSQQSPHSPDNGLYQLSSAAGSEKTRSYASSKGSYLELPKSSTAIVSGSSATAPTLPYKETDVHDRHCDTRNGIGKPPRDEDGRSKSPKDQEQDFEPTTFLNLLFGPKSPEIPSGSYSDEDQQDKQLQKKKPKKDEILSESSQISQSASFVNNSEVNSVLSAYIQSKGASCQSLREYQFGHLGQGTPYNRLSLQGQFTLHYGKNNLTSSTKGPDRPRGIIRPLPQKLSTTSSQHLNDSTSYDTPGHRDNLHKCSTVSSSKRLTGTVRPWVDNTPRPTSNPEQDISRPVREPVPMEGPPPNKVCTIVKDSLSPIDLLAKYLTWTSSCYTAQKYH